MPRRKVAYHARALPPGVQDAVTALALDGSMPPSEIATRFQIDPLTVRKLARAVENIDPAHVATLKRALPSILTMLGAAHGLEALSRVHSDPAMSLKSTVGAKFAMEAARLSQPQSEQPGVQILAVIQSLNVRPSAPSLESLNAAEIETAEFVAQAGEDLPPDAESAMCQIDTVD